MLDFRFSAGKPIVTLLCQRSTDRASSNLQMIGNERILDGKSVHNHLLAHRAQSSFGSPSGRQRLVRHRGPVKICSRVQQPLMSQPLPHLLPRHRKQAHPCPQQIVMRPYTPCQCPSRAFRSFTLMSSGKTSGPATQRYCSDFCCASYILTFLNCHLSAWESQRLGFERL